MWSIYHPGKTTVGLTETLSPVIVAICFSNQFFRARTWMQPDQERGIKMEIIDPIALIARQLKA